MKFADVWDWCAVAGGACLVGGLAWIYPPLGPISLGLGLLTLSILGARRWGS